MWALGAGRSEADHPINGRAVPPDIVAGLLALVVLVKKDLPLHVVPLAEKQGVLDPARVKRVGINIMFKLIHGTS